MASISPRPWKRHLVDETIIVDANGEFVACFSLESEHEYAKEEKRINKNIDFVLHVSELLEARKIIAKAKGE